MKQKGWIALDIDGTITLDKYSVPIEVIDYLASLERQGWRIVLATGRAFIFASAALNRFNFPYVLLPQNGSVALHMPEKKLLFKSYLPSSAIQAVEDAYRGFDSDFVVYTGYDKEDRCYWRPSRLSNEDIQYVEDLRSREKESWQEVEKFDIDFNVPLIKCFGHPKRMKVIADRLLETGIFQISHIKDPFHPEYTLLLVTDKKTSKGSSLTELFRLEGRGEMVIAAGDDENDISLLNAADIKIAMAHAPEKLQEIADFIAPPTKDNGIIQALQMSLRYDDR